MNCPCRDCKKRTIHCHGHCEEYLQWSKWNEERRELYHKEVHNEYIANSDSRRQRRKRKL